MGFHHQTPVPYRRLRWVAAGVVAVVVASLGLLPARSVDAASLEEVVLDGFGEPGDQFGYAVDLDGSGMIVGAPFDDYDGADSRGSITYVRETTTGWDNKNKINFYTDDPLVETAPWMAGNDVAIEGTTTVVGAPLHPVVDGGSLYMQGVAIVLEWVDGDVASAAWEYGFYRSEFFGDSVDLNGSMAAGGPFASVYCDDIEGCPPGEEWADLLGRVEVDGDWVFPEDPRDDLQFGWDVAVDGDRLAVSAEGAVYVFENFGDWHQIQKISVDHGGVAMDEDLLVIGDALAINPNGIGTGVVWVYRWDGAVYALEDTLWPGGSATPAFGASVAVDGDLLVVGAPNADGYAGAAYVYERSVSGDWMPGEVLEAPAPEAFDVFGHDVAVSGYTVAVGSPGDSNENGASAGAVYVFDISTLPAPTTTTTTTTTTTMTTTVPAGVGTFSDDDGSVFEDDIEWLAAEGITQGCNPPANTLFCPADFVTRGQMAAFLVRAFGFSDDGGGDLFVDDDNSVFEDDIDRLGTAGVTKGCNPPANTMYCPAALVTRGQMAAFLVRAFGFSDDGGGDLFVDDDNSVFEDDIDRLGTAGVTKGCNPPANTMFCPDDFVSRGQMAAFLHRAMDG